MSGKRVRRAGAIAGRHEERATARIFDQAHKVGRFNYAESPPPDTRLRMDELTQEVDELSNWLSVKIRRRW